MKMKTTQIHRLTPACPGWRWVAPGIQSKDQSKMWSMAYVSWYGRATTIDIYGWRQFKHRCEGARGYLRFVGRASDVKVREVIYVCILYNVLRHDDGDEGVRLPLFWLFTSCVYMSKLTLAVNQPTNQPHTSQVLWNSVERDLSAFLWPNRFVWPSIVMYNFPMAFVAFHVYRYLAGAVIRHWWRLSWVGGIFPYHTHLPYT